MSQKGLENGTKTGVGSLADPAIIKSWEQAWKLLGKAPKTSPYEAYSWIAEQMGIQRRAVKRKLKNYRKYMDAQGTPVQPPRFARVARTNDASRSKARRFQPNQVRLSLHRDFVKK